MRPDEETNNAFIYCLAEAASRFRIQVLFTVAMSNHRHTGIHDPEGNYPAFLEHFHPEGNYPAFLEHFHKLFAKCQNALRGRWENFGSSEQTSVVRLRTVVSRPDSTPRNCPIENVLSTSASSTLPSPA